MKSLICGVSVLALVVAAGLASQQAGAADDKATPEVIMKKLCVGKTSPFGTIRRAVRKDAPDWAKVKEATATIAEYAPKLGENDPPRGEKASWDKLTKALAETSKELDEAAKKEDLESTKNVVKKLAESCEVCHTAHRPEEDD